MARTHVLLPDDLLKAIDRRVGPRGRSRFLEEAARKLLRDVELDEAIEASFGIAKDEDYPHWKDAETTYRWVRALREGKDVGP